MIKENSYLSIAEKAYFAIQHMYKIGGENEFSASAQKTAERYLKAVIEYNPSEKFTIDVMKTHSLIKLYNELKHLNYIGLDRSQIKELNGYYFEASYPGDNFRVVTPYEEQLCKEALDHIRGRVIKFFEQKEFNTNEFNE